MASVSESTTPYIFALPNEILVAMFSECLPPYPNPPPFTGSGSPTHLLRICRLWRDIALATPTLWRAIRITDWESDDQTKCALAWLQRSGGSLLSLRIEFHTVERSQNMAPALFQAILDARRRWEYAHFELPMLEARSLSGSAPNLVSLQVIVSRMDDGVEAILEDAHRLRNLAIWNLRFGANSLPWNEVTCLSLTSVELPDCLAALPLATRLVRLKWDLVDSAMRVIPPKPIHLPVLEDLVLLGTRYGDTMVQEGGVSELDLFTLPSLRRLEIASHLLQYIPHDIAIEHIQSFLHRSGCSLQRLHIVRLRGASVDRDFTAHKALGDACAAVLSGIVVQAGLRMDVESVGDEWNMDYWKTEEYWEKSVE